MQSSPTVLRDDSEATAFIDSSDRLVVLFTSDYDITPVLDQAASLGFTSLNRQWEDFTLARTGMEFTR
jgi:hypothetical protein